MANKKVEKLAEDIQKLSPAGQDVIKTMLGDEEAAGRIADAGKYITSAYIQEPGFNGKKTELALTEDPENSSATVLLALEEMTKNNAVSIEKLGDDIRELNRILKDSFENDATYREAAEKVKEAQVVALQIKKEIMKQPATLQMAEKLKEKRSEMREKKAALSDYLLEYQRMTGATQLELFDGEVVEIQNSAKLVKRRSK